MDSYYWNMGQKRADFRTLNKKMKREKRLVALVYLVEPEKPDEPQTNRTACLSILLEGWGKVLAEGILTG